MIRWPWTSLQALNLDWILAKLKEVVDKVNAYSENITASATTGAAGTNASVTVTGDLDTGLDFAFTIPRGNTGATGPEGPEGPEGPQGQGLTIMGMVSTVSDLPASANIGDVWLVGSALSNTARLWDGTTWKNIGSIQNVNGVGNNSGFVYATNANLTGFTGIVVKRADSCLDVYLEFTITAEFNTAEAIGQFDWTTNIPFSDTYPHIINVPIFNSNFTHLGALTVVTDSSKFKVYAPAPSGSDFVLPASPYHIYFTIPYMDFSINNF